MESQWQQVEIQHNIIRNKRFVDDTESPPDSIIFDQESDTMYIEEEFAKLRKLSQQVKQYASQNGLLYKPTFDSKPRFTVFQPFDVKENIKVSKLSTLYISQDEFSNFNQMRKDPYWQTGYKAHFTLHYKVIKCDISKEIKILVQCKKIILSDV